MNENMAFNLFLKTGDVEAYLLFKELEGTSKKEIKNDIIIFEAV